MFIPDHAKDNYTEIVASGASTWASLAEQFEKDGETALAEWASEQASTSGDTKATAKAAAKAEADAAKAAASNA